MKLQSVGLYTDLSLIGEDTIIENKDDYIVVKSPSNPNFFWGNYIIFSSKYKSNINCCINIFKKEFKTLNYINHVAFTWDIDMTYLSTQHETTNVLILKGDKIKESISEYDVRIVDLEKEWNMIVNSQIKHMSTSMNNKIVNVTKKRYQHYFNLINQGQGEWFGAFKNDELVGSLGLFNRGEYARFQNVETSEGYRNQGVCSHLLSYSVDYFYNRKPDTKFVICSEKNSSAERLYRALGFKKIEVLESYCKYPILNTTSS